MLFFLRNEGGAVDSIDTKILELLQQNGRMTVSGLSKALNLSRPSVSERLRRLEERPIIEGFAARISPAAVGRDVLVMIEIDQLTVAYHSFEEFVTRDPDVLECHRSPASSTSSRRRCPPWLIWKRWWIGSSRLDA